MARFVPTGGLMTSASAIALLPGQLTTFGTGRFLVIFDSRNFTVPAGINQVRARVTAGGGGKTQAGGSSSFGTYLSATGGQPGTAGAAGPGGLGGTGVGGDFQASGGPGGAGEGAGGGAAGSELGDGGAGGLAHVGQQHGGGGAAVGGVAGGNAGSFQAGFGASPFGLHPLASGGFQDFEGNSKPSSVNPIAAVLPFPTFAFLGNGRYPASNNGSTVVSQAGGPGCGGGGGPVTGGNPRDGTMGGLCGGGGGASITVGSASLGGRGGLWTGQGFRNMELDVTSANANRFVGGGHGGAKNRSGSGGGGYARGVIAVLPGQVIACTVAAQNDTDGTSGGLIIVEW